MNNQTIYNQKKNNNDKKKLYWEKNEWREKAKERKMFDRILMSDILYFNIGNIIQLYGAAFGFVVDRKSWKL